MTPPDPAAVPARVAYLRARGCPVGCHRPEGRPSTCRPPRPRSPTPAYHAVLVREQAEVLDELFAESVTVLREALWRDSERSQTRAAEQPAAKCGPPSTATGFKSPAAPPPADDSESGGGDPPPDPPCDDPAGLLNCGDTGADRGSRHGRAVHLQHPQPDQALRQAGGAQGHLPELLPGGQDRGAGQSNGAGKSTLLKIMAGQDKEFMGEAFPEAGASIGYVPQEPLLAAGQDGPGDRRRGGGPHPGAAQEARGPGRGDGRPGGRLREAVQPDGAGAGRDRRDCNAYDIDRTVEMAMDAMRLPPSDAVVDVLSGGEKRRVYLCRDTPPEPRPAAPGRADQPPGRGERGVAGEAPRAVPRGGGGRDARPLLPGQRGRGTSWSWTAARASRGSATTHPGSTKSAGGWPSKRSRRAPGRRCWSGSWSGPRVRRGRG